MMNSGISLVQAVEWKKECYGVATGTFKNATVLSCLEDGDVTAHFTDGDETISFLAGSDVTLARVDVTIVSGSFAVN